MSGIKSFGARGPIFAAGLWFAIASSAGSFAAAQEAGTLPETAAPAGSQTGVPATQSPSAPDSAPAQNSATMPPAYTPASPTSSALNPDQSAPPATSAQTDQSGQAAQAVPPAAPPQKTYVVPAGTKVLLTLQSSINTKSARPGDGVYLMSAFPVIVGNRVLIPAGMYVQGTVDSVERHIRIKGHAKLNMHFTSMIFPNGTVIEIPGVVSGIPGSKGPHVKDGGEGTVEQSGGVGDVIKSAGKGAEIGAGGGVIVGAVENHPFEGGGIGAAGGALVGAAVSLFTHGNDIDIVSGSQVEMVLQRPLILQESNIADANSGQMLVPAVQRQPMAKPNQRRVLCPVGVPCQN